ncbi:hypothetical protein MTP03_25360 [Tsukamurella sp. PLM1]|nr:hypothetical protein MTP03_25360 [Tsukamurella sp. PLM1]
MTRAATVLKLAYAALAAVDTTLSASSRPARHRARRYTKPLLLPVLAASFAADPRARRSPLRRTTLAGQAAGWVGDVALLGDEPRHFALGASAFATGHAAYITGLLAERDPAASLARPATVEALWAVGAPRTLVAAYRTEPLLAPVLAGYSALLAVPPRRRPCSARRSCGCAPRHSRGGGAVPAQRFDPGPAQVRPRRPARLARGRRDGDVLFGPVPPRRRCRPRRCALRLAIAP